MTAKGIGRLLAALCAPLLLAAAAPLGTHEGVASCGGTTCHGRQQPSGAVVRQNELLTWQDDSSQAGAHSRAYKVLLGPRAAAIAAKLGIGAAGRAPECLGCHADPAPPALRGPRFDIADGVGCEACHGGSGGWLASHYAVGATHAGNVARGMAALDDVKVRAGVCLDCHLNAGRKTQFVTHRIMAAGHPRLSFELDLFTALQQHHSEDADYRQRKVVAGGVKTWAVGQAMALDRALALYANPAFGQDGAFPQLVFFDCHACHRAISDKADWRPAALANPGRAVTPGTPVFNDENLIMLSAAARIAAPGDAARLEADSRAFHAAMLTGRADSVRAAATLAATARRLSDGFARASFGKGQTLAMLGAVLESPRYTDYAGAAQAVMAADTLLNALAASGQVDRRDVRALRPDLDRAYAQVRDPNGFKPAEFRQSFARLSAAVARLR